MIDERLAGPWQSFKTSPLQTIHKWQAFRLTWLIMLTSALILELCALCFQYILQMDPCELCVYQRLAILLLAFSSLLILISPRNPVLRIIGYALWATAGFYGLSNAITQTRNYDEIDLLNYSCSFRPTFPLDLPLDTWVPWLFMPTGICGADNWVFLNLNMAHWMIIVFSIYLCAFAACIISSMYWLLFVKQTSS